MFEVGDFVVYGTNGVCEVTSVGPVSLPGQNTEKLYYKLVPCYIRDTSILTPVDNKSVAMRPVMTKDEAEKLIDRMGDIQELEITETRKRDQEYKEALQTADADVLVGLIKTISDRISERIATGKKVTSSDTRYINQAEGILYGEIAVSLGIRRDQVPEYLEGKLDPVTV